MLACIIGGDAFVVPEVDADIALAEPIPDDTDDSIDNGSVTIPDWGAVAEEVVRDNMLDDVGALAGGVAAGYEPEEFRPLLLLLLPLFVLLLLLLLLLFKTVLVAVVLRMMLFVAT